MYEHAYEGGQSNVDTGILTTHDEERDVLRGLTSAALRRTQCVHQIH